MKRYTIIANWKMQYSLNESLSWLSNHHKELNQLTESCNFILCPDTIALKGAHEFIKSSSIALGAQNCSRFLKGAYTGETSVQSLIDAGVTYCIVGHYERRHYFHETDEEIAQKCLNLTTVGITPILCVGPANPDHTSIPAIIEKQLHHLKTFWLPGRTIYIAYEPAYSIGTEQQAPLMEIMTVGQSIKEYLTPAKVVFLYGGSADEKLSEQLLNMPVVDGLLLGRASLDFQNLKKIVSSLPKAP